MRLFMLSAATALAFAVSGAARAADAYVFDRAHTSILFFINHLGFSNMVGEFHDYDGELTLDPAAPEKSALKVTIRMASVDTDVPELDKKLAKKDFFHAEAFPEATFSSTKITLLEPNRASVEGDLTLLGVTKPVTLDVRLNKQDLVKYTGKYTLGFSATGVLKRSDFGMSQYIPDVGDEVRLVIETEMWKQEPEGSPVKR